MSTHAFGYLLKSIGNRLPRGLAESILEHSPAWQMPFAPPKFAPIFANNSLHLFRRVLDVGCGPGTHTTCFSGAEYLGLDINEHRIRDARSPSRAQFPGCRRADLYRSHGRLLRLRAGQQFFAPP